MTGYADAIAVLGAALLFLAGVGILAVLGIILARLWAEVQRARSHRISADAQEEVVAASAEALDDVSAARERNQRITRDYGAPPSDEELFESVMRGRQPDDDGDITTMRNEHVEETSPIPPDSQFNYDKYDEEAV